jgi:hypothetical protein
MKKKLCELTLEEAWAMRRREMGLTGAKLLIVPVECRELTPEEKKAGRRIRPVVQTVQTKQMFGLE